MKSRRNIYIHSISSVLLPYMHIELPIDHIKNYHMQRERRGDSLTLGIIYNKKNYPFTYGCTATVVRYDSHHAKATLLGLERFQRLFVSHNHITRVRYIFDHQGERENVWVKQLKVIECLEIIATRYDMKINMRHIRGIPTAEFSFVIAATGFFNSNDRYKLLATKNISERLDLELSLLNTRFVRAK